MTPDEHYKKYVNLIRQKAWEKVRRNGHALDFEELMAVGNLAYAEALQSHDPDKGAFSTHLTYCLRHRLGKAVKGANKYKDNTMSMSEGFDAPDSTNTARAVAFGIALEGLGAEARHVAHLVLDSPLELVDLTRQEVAVRASNIKRYLASEGWPKPLYMGAINEIKAMLRAL